MKAVRLKVNDRLTPMGILAEDYRFRWNCTGEGKQAAYRLFVKNGKPTSCLMRKVIRWVIQ